MTESEAQMQTRTCRAGLGTQAQMQPPSRGGGATGGREPGGEWQHMPTGNEVPLQHPERGGCVHRSWYCVLPQQGAQPSFLPIAAALLRLVLSHCHLPYPSVSLLEMVTPLLPLSTSRRSTLFVTPHPTHAVHTLLLPPSLNPLAGENRQDYFSQKDW